MNEREQIIFDLRTKGCSMRQIALVLGVSVTRAHRLAKFPELIDWEQQRQHERTTELKRIWRERCAAEHPDAYDGSAPSDEGE
jgi:hypothetical protein